MKILRKKENKKQKKKKNSVFLQANKVFIMWRFTKHDNLINIK